MVQKQSTRKIISGITESPLTAYERDIIFWKGVKANALGQPITYNPYINGSDSFREWQLGWNAAEDEQESNDIGSTYGEKVKLTSI